MKNTISPPDFTVNLNCPHQALCSVCPWLVKPLSEQKISKSERLKASLNGLSLPSEIPFHLPASQKLRERVDLTTENGKLGFYQVDRQSILEPTQCLQMSAELFSFYQEIKGVGFPIKKGSLRLRTHKGLKGLWLDFANEDIKFLFEEKKTLQKILETNTIIEVGQRRKSLQFDGEKFSLSKTPRLDPWSSTWTGDQEIPLFSTIGSFTQSGSAANKVIIARMEEMLKRSEASSWLEFGSGNGNLSFPLAHLKKSLTAVEYDELSLAGFEKSLSAFPSLREKIIMKHGDFQRGSSVFAEKFEGILANPPRSGLKDFLNILENQKPSDFIYMSCFLDSFAVDAKKIINSGYSLAEIEIIDQFPHSEHFEILARFAFS